MTDHVSLQEAMLRPTWHQQQQQQQYHQLARQPSIVVVEEPTPRVRFRYATEGDKAGNIYGVSSTGSQQTFPTVVVSLRFIYAFMLSMFYFFVLHMSFSSVFLSCGPVSESDPMMMMMMIKVDLIKQNLKRLKKQARPS